LSTQADIYNKVSAWCLSYVDAFSAFEAPLIADHWDYPATVLQSGRLFSFPDAQSFIRNVDNLCRFYREQNVAAAVRELLDVYYLADGVVSIRTGDQMIDDSGHKIVSWQSAYTLRETASGWRAIFAVADGETQAWKARGTPLGS